MSLCPSEHLGLVCEQFAGHDGPHVASDIEWGDDWKARAEQAESSNEELREALRDLIERTDRARLLSWMDVESVMNFSAALERARAALSSTGG